MAVYCHMSSCLFVILVPDLTVKLVLRPKDDPPLLGRNYKLECKHTLGPYVDSSKFKFTYEWFEVNDDKQIAKEKESSISFQPFKLPHFGIYYCKVTLSCEGKIVDEKETDELDMASIGMITLLVYISYLVISFLIHKYTLLTLTKSIFEGHTSKLCIVAVIGFSVNIPKHIAGVRSIVFFPTLKFLSRCQNIVPIVYL